jgi:hypothetical protein
MATKRLPLSGTYNTRPDTDALSGASGVVGVGIVGVMIVGAANSGTGKDHRKVNCLNITVVDDIANGKRVYLEKRPGFATSITPAASSIGTAIHVWAGQGSGQKIMSCFGNTNSVLYDSTTSKGTMSGLAKHITETSISGTATLTVASADSSLWYYQDGGSATQVTDVDYPGNAGRTTTGPLSHLEGYGFIMDTTGRIYNSDLNSVTAWTAASFKTANSTPDIGVAAWRHRDVILAFCKQHIEAWRNDPANTAGSPLSRIDEMTLNIGCLSEHAITEVAGTVYFAGTTKGAHVGIYAYNGGQWKKISTPEIEAQLVIAGAGNITMTALGFYGRHHLWINASSTTFGYCIEETEWYEVSGIHRIWYKADGVSAGTSLVNYVVSNVSTSGKVYVMNPAAPVYQDDGNSYTAVLQSSVVDFGTRHRKRYNRVTYIGDEQATSTNLSLSYSDDDYQSFSTARTFDLSENTPFMTRLGTAKRRAWVFSHSGNSPMRAEALEFDYEVLER